MRLLFIVFSLILAASTFADPVAPAVPSSTAAPQVSSTDAGNAKSPTAGEGSSKPEGEKAKDTTPPKGAFEIFSEYWAWPSVTLLLLFVLHQPLLELLKVVTEKIEKAKRVVWGDTVTIESTDGFVKESQNAGMKVKITGDPDQFRLVCKATNRITTKSTKVMNLPNGCLVQVSTREEGASGTVSVAEALAFVPAINIEIINTPQKSTVAFRTPVNTLS